MKNPCYLFGHYKHFDHFVHFVPSGSKQNDRGRSQLPPLRSSVEAMGGELEITAKFPQGAVMIRQFETIEGEPTIRVNRRFLF
jgi:hypothetical protein